MSGSRGTGSSTPLYQSIADELAAMIAAGTLAEGDRLLSVRELSRAKSVSIPTIVEAYRVLEDRGLIAPRDRSGHYVRAKSPVFRRPRPVRTSGRPTEVRTLQATQLVMTASQRPGLLPFGAAVPTPALFPLARLRSIMARLIRHNPEILGSYDFAPGAMDLRREVSRRSLRWGCTVDPANVVITNGCVEAVGLALRAVTKPGDIVAVETPTYYGFLNLLEVLGLRAIEIRCDPVAGMSVEALANAARGFDIRACLLSTTVSNPTGATMSGQAKKELVEIARRHDITVIEDATFADLQFAGDTLAARSFDTQGNVILCASATKTVAPGLRIGWVDGGPLADRISYLKRVSSIGQPELNQLALAEYMASGGYERHLRQLVRVLGQQVGQHLQAIADLMPDGVGMERPTGGFLLWLELPRQMDSLELHRRALGFGIGLAPGTMFSADGRYRSHIRVNCGQVWSPQIALAYEQLAGLVRSMM